MSGTDSGGNTYRRWTRLFLVMLTAGCVIGIVVPAGLGWDFANFYDAGRRVAAGQSEELYSPDNSIAGQPPQGTTGFFGTPISALLYTPLAAFGPETALVLFKIQNVLAFGVAFGVLFSFYRAFPGPGAAAMWRFAAEFVFLCLIFQPFWTIFRVGGQTTPTVFLLAAVGLVSHTRGRFWISALCMVGAVLIKPALAAALLALALISGLTFARRLAVVLAVTGLVSILALGWPVHAAFLDLMQRSSRLTYAWYFNSSIYILGDVAGQFAHAFPAVFRLGVVYTLKATVVIGTVWLVARNRAEHGPAAARRHFNYLIAVLFFLLWSPTVWEHYLSLLFLPLIYIVAARAHFSRQALALVAAIFVTSVAQNLIVVNWVRYNVELDNVLLKIAVPLLKCAPLLLTMVLMARHASEFLRSFTAAAWEQVETSVVRLPPDR
jgi:hypothetical protein